MLQAELFDLEIFANAKWRRQKGTFHSGKFWTGSSPESIFERVQACSHEKDELHDFLSLGYVFHLEATSHNGKEYTLKFRTQSNSKEHFFAFGSASAWERCLAQFKS
jgi:hypothetical protein